MFILFVVSKHLSIVYRLAVVFCYKLSFFMQRSYVHIYMVL